MDDSDKFVAFMDRGAREMSTISFPYVDLDEAINVARMMLDRGGGVPMDRDQVAAAINSAGGTLALKTSAAKQFGLIDSQSGKWSITPLGHDILDPAREKASRSIAFLNVELYRRTYDEYRGRMLPSRTGLEHAFTTFGVAAKQKEKARQTFERSARSAGYFPNGDENRLVAPVIPADGPSQPAAAEPAVVERGSPAVLGAAHAAAFPNPDMHPFIAGLLSELPPIKEEWSMEDRAKWLQAAAQIFDLIYAGGRGRITVMADG